MEENKRDSKLLTDKKVDEIIEAKGLINLDVFYSPRSVYFYTVAMGMAYGGLGGILLLICLVWSYKILIIPLLFYLILIYISNHYLNNSFALSANELFVINTSIFFEKFTVYRLEDIIQVNRKVHRVSWMHFLLLPSSYIEIVTNKGLQKHYCIWLEDDYFDENTILKTMECFEHSLKNLDIKTEFWYPYEN